MSSPRRFSRVRRSRLACLSTAASALVVCVALCPAAAAQGAPGGGSGPAAGGGPADGMSAPPPDAPPPDAPAPEPEAEPKKNGIYADLSLGVLGVGYERVLGDTVALNLTAHYYRPWYVSDHVFGFGGELRAFVFVTDTAPEGLYFAPGVRLDYARAELDPEELGPDRVGGETEFEGHAWGAKMTLGYGAVLFDALSLRVGVGVQSHAADLATGPGDPDFSGAYPAVDFLAGGVF